MDIEYLFKEAVTLANGSGNPEYIRGIVELLNYAIGGNSDHVMFTEAILTMPEDLRLTTLSYIVHIKDGW